MVGLLLRIVLSSERIASSGWVAGRLRGIGSGVGTQSWFGLGRGRLSGIRSELGTQS